MNKIFVFYIMAFVNAEIMEIAPDLWQLTIYYTYYNLYSFKEVYPFKTLEEARNKLLEIRCYGKLSIVKLTEQELKKFQSK